MPTRPAVGAGDRSPRATSARIKGDGVTIASVKEVTNNVETEGVAEKEAAAKNRPLVATDTVEKPTEPPSNNVDTPPPNTEARATRATETGATATEATATGAKGKEAATAAESTAATDATATTEATAAEATPAEATAANTTAAEATKEQVEDISSPQSPAAKADADGVSVRKRKVRVRIVEDDAENLSCSAKKGRDGELDEKRRRSEKEKEEEQKSGRKVSESGKRTAARGEVGDDEEGTRNKEEDVDEEEKEDKNSTNEDESEESEEATAARIAEEFSNWKVNCRVLYDLIMSHTLEWPSLTVQWLPGLLDAMAGDSSTVRQQLLLGTHTSGAEENFLQVMEVTLPGSPLNNAAAQVYAERGADEYEGFAFGRSPCKFKVIKRFPHPGEVNCARYMPQQPSLVATTAVDGGVLIYDISQTSATSTGPDIRCSGHNEECFGLAWSPQQQGIVASASNSGSVCLHHMQQQRSSPVVVEGEKQTNLEPLQVFHVTTASLNDCCWLPGEPHLLLCCSDDSKLYLLDTRTNSSDPSLLAMDARGTHVAGGEYSAEEPLRLTCVSADMQQVHTFVCGDSIGNLRVFDRRRGNAPVHIIEKAHKDEITRVACCPNEEGLLLTASRDRFVSLFDLKRTGQEQSEEDAEDGPPELVFTHGGHIAAVSDASWNGEDIASLDKAIASVGEDNKLQLWQLVSHSQPSLYYAQSAALYREKRAVFLEDDDDDESDDDGEDVE